MSAQSRLRSRSRRLVGTPLRALVVAALACGGVAVVVPAQAAPSAPSGPADATSAPDAATAAAIAAKYHHPVTDLSSLTATNTARLQPDGTTKLTISTEPVRVRRGSAWADVSTKLAKASDGMVAPAATPTPVEFSVGGPGPLARVQTPSGQWMSVASPLGALPQGVVDGSSITYPEVLPGVDLRLSATTSGMSEVLVVKTAQAAANPRLSALRFAIAGAQVKPGEAQDSATATAADGTSVVSPTPMWWDSSDGGTADGPGGVGITRPVKGGTDASAVVVDAGDAARTPGVTYPVFVDPDWTAVLQGWTFVDAAYPTSGYWMGNGHDPDPVPHVGYITANYSGDGRNHTDRSFWQLDTSALPGKHIMSAQFQTTESYSADCNYSSFTLYITGGINSGTTWNSQPAFVQPVSSASLGPAGRCSVGNQPVGFVATSVAQWAASNGNTNMTVGMKADNEGSIDSWRKFLGAAQMIVTYNTPPATPWAPWNHGAACSTTAPGPSFTSTAVNQMSLDVSISDADGDSITTHFWVTNRDTGASAGSFSAGPTTARDSVVTIGSLAEGNYQWNSRSFDGTDWSPGYSPTCYFRVDNTAPQPPSITPSATTGPAVTVGTPMTMKLAPAAGDTDVVGYAWTWGPSANAPTYAQMPACGGDTSLGGIHYVCGSSPTLTVSPETAPAPTFSVWAFDAAGNRSAVAQVKLSNNAADSTALAGSAHQWTTGLTSVVPAAQCPSGTTTVSCVADNNSSSPWPIALPSGVTVDDSRTTGASTLTYVAGAVAKNGGLSTATLTVPAGVTSADLGVVTVETANAGQAAGATLPGWTSRDDQANPAGEYSSSTYIFTRLGGQQAGDVLTVTLPGSTAAAIAAAWYDTGGRDVQAVGPLWDTGAKSLTTVTWPAPSYTGTADVLLVAADRTPNGPMLSTPDGATIDYQQFITANWSAGGIFGHASNVSPTTFSGTWDAGATSRNVNAMQLVLAPAPSGITPGGPVGVLNFAATSTTPMISNQGVVVDTSKSFTVGAWITPTQPTGGYMTALSERGVTNSGFFLQLTDTLQWKFLACSTTTNSCGAAIAPGTASLNQPVYASGVYDAINHEVRLYLNGSSTPAAVVNFWRDASPSASGGLTIGSAWWNSAFADPFVGQIGDPVVAQGVLTPDQIAQLKNETFFVSDLG